jgi:sigma-B regulation protein RsbU (phosphoserine phosphatase)
MATDGFWESENVSGEMYGKEKICDLIRAHSELSAKGILNIFIDSLYRFARGKKFEDDVTLVVIKIK